MRRRRYLVLMVSTAAIVVLLASGCAPGRCEEGSGEGSRKGLPLPTAAPPVTAGPAALSGLQSGCPVTRSPEPPFTPPSPHPSRSPYAGEFWYGTDALWTLLANDGTWRGLPHNPQGYTQKVFWWRSGYNGRAEPRPNLTVTGRGVRPFAPTAPAPPLAASGATNAFHPDFQWAMLTGVDVPTLGCWEMTGRLSGHDLSFVVWLAP
ncbi:MAG: hypothetical protein HY259_11385 [Chloroflexi bacterium]|nr:hypothetical protein [Chloroflexota bacterium]